MLTRVTRLRLRHEQKQQIAHDLTEAMVAIEGERMRGVTWCVIEEVKSGDWAVGGQPVTTEAVRALAKGEASLLSRPPGLAASMSASG